MQYGHQTRRLAFRKAAASYSAGGHKPPRARRRSRRFWELFLVTAVVAGLLGMKVIADTENSVIDTHNRVIAAEALVVKIKPPRVDAKKLKPVIEGLIAAHSELNISIEYIDLKDDLVLHYGSDQVMTAASVGKLVTAAMLLSEIDAGRRSLADPIGGSTTAQALKAMIEVSDNLSWLQFNESLGYDRLDAYGASIGIKPYDSYLKTMPASGIAGLLKRLYNGQLLSAASTQRLLGHMKAANYRAYIPAAISGSTVYHKFGFLPDLANDAAIIDNGEYPYVLVIFTSAKNGVYNFPAGRQLIRSITTAIDQNYR